MSWQVTRIIKHGVECLGKSLTIKHGVECLGKSLIGMEWNVLASHSYN